MSVKQFDDFQKCNIWSFDIDGVLNNYPILWLDFLFSKTKKRFENTENAKLELKENYGILKHQYRTDGIKFNYLIDNEIKCLFELLNSQKKQIIISTTRPFDKYPMMYNQTVEWLIRNNIKFSKLTKKYNPYINFDIHIDNELEHIIELNKIFDNKKHILYTKHNPLERNKIFSSNIDITIVDNIAIIINILNV